MCHKKSVQSELDLCWVAVGLRGNGKIKANCDGVAWCAFLSLFFFLFKLKVSDVCTCVVVVSKKSLEKMVDVPVRWQNCTCSLLLCVVTYYKFETKATFRLTGSDILKS